MSRCPRIAVLLTDLIAGGLQRQGLTQAKLLAARGFDVTVVTAYTRPEESGELLDEIARAGLTLVRVPQVQRVRLPGKLGAILNLLLVAWTFVRLRPRLVYSHGYIHLHRQVLVAHKRCMGWRLVHKELNPVSLFPESYRRLGRDLAARSDLVFAVCESVRRDLIEQVGYRADNVLVLHNALDAEYARPLPRPDGPPCIGTVGRLDPQKDLGTFLRAAAIARKERADLTFVIYGGGPLADELHALAEELGVSEAVRFVPGFPPSRAPEIYAGMDIFTLTSLDEGLPNTVMEAMACGVPVLATAVGGVPEMIEDGVSGMLVAPGDAEGIARAWLDLLGDDDRRRGMAEAGRSRILDLCSPDTVADELTTIFHGLLGVAAP
jgi:glycosyltransferase involved in cell wall biosynthesis